MKTVEERVKEIVREKLKVKASKEITSSTEVDELGADSIDVVDLIAELEGEFGIDIPSEDASDLKSIQQIAEYIENKQANASLSD
ncbi:acyl carrier protein [Streptomyces lasiicapitis]|uniref:acyl carrier protein n=1 Tax=Streptomyces lasiicapitis TaxID=1923961 RepID=UPI00368AC39C